jgi:hypothetical protein
MFNVGNICGWLVKATPRHLCPRKCLGTQTEAWRDPGAVRMEPENLDLPGLVPHTVQTATCCSTE